MHVTRLLKYGLLFTALFWLWLYALAFLFSAWPPLIILFYVGVLMILYLLTTMFFSQVEATFLRGATLGSSLLLTVTILDSAQRAATSALNGLATGFSGQAVLLAGIEQFAFDIDLDGVVIGAIIVGVFAILPQTAVIARRIAQHA